jgi:hypothetical protein
MFVNVDPSKLFYLMYSKCTKYQVYFFFFGWRSYLEFNAACISKVTMYIDLESGKYLK